MDRKREDMSDRELLVRIDERTDALQKRMDSAASRIHSLEIKWYFAAGGIIALGMMLMKSEKAVDAAMAVLGGH